MEKIELSARVSTPGTDSVDVASAQVSNTSRPSRLRGRTASSIKKDNNTRHQFNLFRIFLVASISATTYIMIPVTNAQGYTNYWAYYLVKIQFWAAFGNSVFVEITEACIPGAPLIVYTYAYLFGWLTPPILHTVAWALGTTDSLAFNTLALTSSLISIAIFYGAWQVEESRRAECTGGMNLTEGGDAIMHDAFAATIDVEELLEEGDEELAEPLQTGEDFNETHRANWMRRCKRFVEQSRQVSGREFVTECGMSDSEGGDRTRSADLSTVTANPLLQSEATTKVDILVGTLRGLSTHSLSGLEKRRASSLSGRPLTDHECGRDYFTGLLGPESWPALYVIPDLMRRYRLLPRYHYCTGGDLYDARVTARSRLRQFALTVLFIIGWSFEFFVLTIFAAKFRSSNPHNRERWFVAFSVAALVLKVGMKQLGLVLDMGKVGSCSMFFVAEFMTTLFYFTFYRMLFETFISWEVFLSVQCTHILLEWFMYCWRGSSFVYEVMEGLPVWFPPRGLVVMRGLSLRDWQMFLGLDFVTRVIVFLCTAPAFIVMMVATMTCPWIESSLKPIDSSTFCLVVLEIALCVIIELANAYGMYRLFFANLNMNLLNYATACFKNKRFCAICLGLATCLLINPLAVFETYSENFVYK